MSYKPRNSLFPLPPFFFQSGGKSKINLSFPEENRLETLTQFPHDETWGMLILKIIQGKYDIKFLYASNFFSVL